MRTTTEPGGFKAEAPGSVVYDQEEIDTKPDGNALTPDVMRLVHLFDSMPVVERRRLLKLVEHYTRMGLGRRVVLEEVAREFASGKAT